MFPLKKRKVAGYPFGKKTYYGTKHTGTDYEANYIEYYAPFNGESVKGFTSGGGNFWQLTRPNGDVLTGRHLSKIIKTGQVKKGELVAITGGRKGDPTAGEYTTHPHLHQEVKVNGKLIDPETYAWDEPVIEYPMTLKIQPIFNNQRWQNEQYYLVELANSLMLRSGGKLNIQWLTSKYTSFTNIPFATAIFPFTSETAEVPDPNWYLENLYPGNEEADSIFFIVNHQDWRDYNPENGITHGYCHSHHPATFPHFISMRCQEGDKSWKFPDRNAFEHYGEHELKHGFCNICGIPDRTHELDYAGRGNESYAEFDYEKINFALGHKRSLNQPMYVFQKDGDPTIYFAVGKVLVPFANTYEAFLADFKDAIVVKLLPDEFLKFRIANQNVVKAR